MAKFPSSAEDEARLRNAVRAARDTRCLRIGRGVRHQAAAVFASLFGSARAVVVADVNTLAAAGRDVCDSLRSEGQVCADPLVFECDVTAEWQFVARLENALADCDAVPVAVGSGTINDLVKLAAHRLKRPYMVVATAASMDGYTAFGASITRGGSKQTFDCAAPQAVIADLDVIATAPAGMNASGYADLLAKCAAGADWILAGAAGAEPIDAVIWDMVQGPLRSWVANPGGIARGEPLSAARLIGGLLVSGFAMQAMQSSRPASGAEHQFSHLWDMQHHTHNGAAPSHGFKVGIGSLASLALYEALLRGEDGMFAIEPAVANWPSWEALDQRIERSLGSGQLAAKAKQETRAKYTTGEAVRAQLTRLRDAWPAVRDRLQGHLLTFIEARDMLREAGCACDPEQIGISRERLRGSYEQAYFIRRRYTVLDFAERWGLAEPALDSIFGQRGPWPAAESSGSVENATAIGVSRS